MSIEWARAEVAVLYTTEDLRYVADDGVPVGPTEVGVVRLRHRGRGPSSPTKLAIT